MIDPIARALALFPLLIVDGAMGAELERRGCDLADPLWSAKVLLETPDVVAAVHRDYLAAGADIICTASYQATVPGLTRRGLSVDEALGVIRLSAEIAVRERDAFWEGQNSAARASRPRPMVAGSVGPYGAFLADGSEFRGDYPLDRRVLAGFHAPRIRALLEGGAEVLACETLPSSGEALILADLLDVDFPEAAAWISFSARDGGHISNGEPVGPAVRALGARRNVRAVGVNCTDPRHIGQLISTMARVTDRPLIVYPNGGGEWDAASKTWGAADPASETLAQRAGDWRARGARLIGGCCRTTPADIAALARALGRPDPA